RLTSIARRRFGEPPLPSNRRDQFNGVSHNSGVENGSPRYQDLIASARVRDRALFLPLRTPNELELQARWFAGEFGKNFVSATGDKIDIVQFGTWNREPGPDFCDAAVRVNGSEPLRGCIEIDLVDRNWDLHGHAINPAFEETVLHVFVDKSDRQFFTRTKSNRNVPQVRIDPAILPEAFSANIPLARPGRCQAPLGNLPEDRVRSVLDAAAQFRLQNKPTRPVNHPQRRLAALAILVQEWPAFRRSLEKRTAAAIEKFFDAFDHPFWKFHYTMTADASLEPMALVGESRVADILANVIFPFWRAEDACHAEAERRRVNPSTPLGASAWPEYAKLPARLTNGRLETAATRLFSDGPRRRKFTKTIAHQQALLQIYEDFCLRDNYDCANCPF